MNKTNQIITFTTAVYLALFLCSPASAQNKYLIKKADRHYNDMQYAAAAPLYKAALENQPDKELIIKIAECYRNLNDSQNSELYFSQAVTDPDATPETYWHYAQALIQNKKYEESKIWFDRYQKAKASDKRAGNYLNSMDKLSLLYRDSSDFQINYLAINSNQNDFSPAFYKGGIAFCSDRKEWQAVKQTFGWNQSAFLNIFYVDPTNLVPTVGNPTMQRISGEVNSRYHEGPLVLYSNSKNMIFTRNNYYQKQYKTDKYGVNRLKLFSANVQGSEWTDIKELPFNSDDYSVGHPALTQDGQTLFFISDMPGGNGQTDIWFVRWEGEGWSAPQNMGNKVNTEGREMFPFVDNNGNLFFASDGLGGLGGLDNFYSHFNGQEFEKPVNLGYPINSSKDDFSLIVSQNNISGYFSSHRNGEKTGDDVYSFTSNKQLIKSFTVELLVLDKESKVPVGGTSIVVTDAGGKEVFRTTADSITSAFSFPAVPETNYIITCEKNGYINARQDVSTAGIIPGEPLKADVLVTRKPMYSLFGIIVDRNDQHPIDSVQVVIKDMTNGIELFNSPTSKSGDFRFILSGIKKGDIANYTIKLSRNGYLTKHAQFNYIFPEPGEVNLTQALDIKLDKVDVGIDIGKILNLKPIYFDLGKSIIRPDAAKELNKIVDVMNENPDMKIELDSHTDSRGSDASNLGLSDKRAKSSAAYIVSKGISAQRITGRGYGESRLVNKCGNGVKCSEEEHRLNRRTEFIVVSVGK